MGYSMDAISKNLSYKIIRILNQVLVTVHFAKYILCSENPRAAGNNSNNNNNYNNYNNKNNNNDTRIGNHYS